MGNLVARCGRSARCEVSDEICNLERLATALRDMHSRLETELKEHKVKWESFYNVYFVYTTVPKPADLWFTFESLDVETQLRMRHIIRPYHFMSRKMEQVSDAIDNVDDVLDRAKNLIETANAFRGSGGIETAAFLRNGFAELKQDILDTVDTVIHDIVQRDVESSGHVLDVEIERYLLHYAARRYGKEFDATVLNDPNSAGSPYAVQPVSA